MFKKLFKGDKKRDLTNQESELLNLCRQLTGNQDVSAEMCQDLLETVASEDELLARLLHCRENDQKFANFTKLTIFVATNCAQKDDGGAAKANGAAANEANGDKNGEMSWEQLTNLYPKVGSVLEMMSAHPELFERDEIAVTVRSLYELVKQCDSTDDVMAFLKKYVDKKKVFASFEALTKKIGDSAKQKREKAARKAERREEKKKEKKKNKKKKKEMDHMPNISPRGSMNGGGSNYNPTGTGFNHTSGGVREVMNGVADVRAELDMEKRKIEDMRKAMVVMNAAKRMAHKKQTLQSTNGGLLPQISP